MIDKEELIKFLKDNLDIRIERDYGFYNSQSLKVSLIVDGVEIASSEVNVYDNGH